MTVDLARSFYSRSVHEVAPELLNKVLVGPNGSGRIVEVEAYGGAADPGSHSFRGITPRTEVMHGPAGHLYVYFTYGMHWCANVVTDPDGRAGAVLLRALAPLGDLDSMFAARAKARRPIDLCSGPAKLCQALGIDGAMHGLDLVEGAAAVTILDDGTAPPNSPGVSTRIGLSAGQDLPWRYYVTGEPNLSRKSPP
ncbi:MAG: DNA-3-methyladenine glycosylase [Acidimicrobiales bacterium]